jgi:hypothetical protein
MTTGNPINRDELVPVPIFTDALESALGVDGIPPELAFPPVQHDLAYLHDETRAGIERVLNVMPQDQEDRTIS